MQSKWKKNSWSEFEKNNNIEQVVKYVLNNNVHVNCINPARETVVQEALSTQPISYTTRINYLYIIYF